MSFSNSTETAILALWLNATTWANVADDAATSPLTNIQESLHTADPGEAGNQTTNEAAYTSYAREAVARSSSGYTVSGNQATHTSAVQFTTATGGSETETHMGLGTAPSGTGVLQGSGTISPNISVSSGVTPELNTSTAISLD